MKHTYTSNIIMEMETQEVAPTVGNHTHILYVEAHAYTQTHKHLTEPSPGLAGPPGGPPEVDRRLHGGRGITRAQWRGETWRERETFYTLHSHRNR